MLTTVKCTISKKFSTAYFMKNKCNLTHRKNNMEPRDPRKETLLHALLFDTTSHAVKKLKNHKGHKFLKRRILRDNFP